MVGGDDVRGPGSGPTNQIGRGVDVYSVGRIASGIRSGEVGADEVALNDIAAIGFEADGGGEAVQGQPAQGTAAGLNDQAIGAIAQTAAV